MNNFNTNLIKKKKKKEKKRKKEFENQIILKRKEC